MTLATMASTYEMRGHAAVHLARAASLAPSPHNTQPWFFVESGHDRSFEVHADPTRRLRLTDPGGREMVIACGAALFNARVAVRGLGFRPRVEPLPDSKDPAFLARVTFGAYAPVSAPERRMARAVAHRRSHRGPFAPDRLPDSLLAELCEEALAEGAVLRLVDDPEELMDLADLVREAEGSHRADPGRTAEISRYVGTEGVPIQACRRYPDVTLLPGRDYLCVARDYVPARGHRSGTGQALVLSTPHDGLRDWLRAGQALERVLLRATTHGVMAAFHTQPLEVPAIRERVRRRFTARQYPQVILRLGRARYSWTTPRRSPTEVLGAG